MKLNFLAAHILLLSLVSACGISDKSENATNTLQTVSCSDRSRILTEGESSSVHFNLGGAGLLSSFLDTGPSLQHLDWGQMKVLDDSSVQYSAPSFIPEARRIRIEGSLVGGHSTPGNCYLHLLDDFTYGVTDDGNTRGLVVTSHALANTLTGIDTAPVKEKAVIAAFNFPLIPGVFTGVSTLAPGSVSLRIKGTLTVNGGNYWFRFKAPNGRLTIDGILRGSSNSTGAEIPATNAPTTAVPNYNTGIALSAGKHALQIDITHNNNASYLLEWTSTKPSATAPANAKGYEPIPRDAFDRD